MNRSFFNVILGDGEQLSKQQEMKEKNKNLLKTEMQMMLLLMKNASSVIIVPGYGMVAPGAACIKRDGRCFKKMESKYPMQFILCRKDARTMNVLLAEANVPYDEVFELEEINNDFANCDGNVIGANDVTNPVAKSDPKVQFMECQF